MGCLTDFMRRDHGHCDEFYLSAERLAAAKDQSAAGAAFARFVEAMTHHFAMEEEVLFPAFEGVTGGEGGPTAVMRHEHGQMRELFEMMGAALTNAQADEFLAQADTLLVLMQQHNAKEERILYPMCDNMLRDTEAVLARMRAVP